MLLWLDFWLEKKKKRKKNAVWNCRRIGSKLVLGTSAPTHNPPPPCFINSKIKRNSRGTRREGAGGWLLNLLFNRRPTFSTDVSRSQRFVWSFRRAGKSDGCKWILDREDDLFSSADVRPTRVSKKKRRKNRQICERSMPIRTTKHEVSFFLSFSSSFCFLMIRVGCRIFEDF